MKIKCATDGCTKTREVSWFYYLAAVLAVLSLQPLYCPECYVHNLRVNKDSARVLLERMDLEERP